MTLNNKLPTTSNQTTGILLMVVGTSIVPVMDAIAKFLGEALSPLTITWGRFVVQFLLMGAWLVFSRRSVSLTELLRPVHMCRGVLLAAATLCFFISLKFLPLADAIGIFFVQPMVLCLFSALFLGETIGWHRRLAVAVGFLGALLIIRPGGDSFTLASLLPLLAAVGFAGYLTLTRQSANSQDPIMMQLSSGFSAMVILSLVLVGAVSTSATDTISYWPDIREWLWLGVMGMIAAVGHLLIVMAMRNSEASVLAPFGYVEIIAATILGWFVFGEWPSSLSWLGIFIICASGFYVFVREQKLANPNDEPFEKEQNRR